MKTSLVFYIACIVSTQSIAILTPLQNNIKRSQRRANALITRNSATNTMSEKTLGTQNTNGDEERYSDKRNSFGKSLTHNTNGLINTAAFAQMVRAIETENSSFFNQISMGTNPVERKLVSPESAFDFSLDGPDGWIFSMPAPPTLTSAENAGEMVELYGHVYLRDVAFNDYDTDADADAVIDALNALSDFKGPKVGNTVTAGTLFRGATPGDLIGPFISQFLYQPIPYGPGPNYDGSGALATQYQEQLVPTTNTANDFMTTFANWSDIQKGENPGGSITYTAARTFIHNARDLGDYVHQDYPQQPHINAALILLSYGNDALDPANPYNNNPTQEAFVSYGAPDLISLLSTACIVALRTAWYQKWSVHRRARPEFCGFLTNQQKTGAQNFNLHSDLIDSNILTLIAARYGGSYYLPQAYPEGSPAHPSYPAGHAVVAGACATILKAFFNEDFVIPNPVEPNADNDALITYTGENLLVGNEINKLAANIALGRDMAGVHYRSDGVQGILLGEKVALALLENETFSRHIPFNGFTLTTFEGQKITIGKKQNLTLYS